MNSFEASLFIIPIGVGSSILFYLLAFNEGVDLLLLESGAYDVEIAILLLIGFSYFICDFILMLVRYNPRNNIYFIHHAVGILSIPIVYFKCYFFVKYLLGYLSYELSTPFLNISLFYYRANITNIVSKTTDMLFIITFIFVRILFGTYLSVKLILALYELEYQYFILLPVIIQCLNYYWLSKIISMFRKKINKSN